MDVFTMDWYWNYTGETETNNTCLNPSITTSDWATISLPIALVIIIFFSFLQRRKKLALGCFDGRPGTVYPVDVLDTYTDRTTYALAFCVCCISILDLFVGNYYFSVDRTHLPSMVRGAVATLLGVVNVIIVGVVHYPLFLCLTVQSKLSGNIVGLLYSVFWSFFYFLGFVDCVQSGDWLSPENIVRNLAVVPINVCYVYLNLRFLLGIFYYLRVCKNTCRKCHKSHKKNEIRMKDEYFEKTHFYQRVTYLLQPSKERKSTHSSSRIMLLVRKLYPSYPGFKYSRRIVCTITLSLLCLYEFGLLYTVEFSEFATEVKDIFILPENSALLLALDKANVSSVYVNSQDFIITLTDTLMPTSVISLVFMAVSMLHALIVYRNDTVRIWGGDRSSFPVQPYSYSKKVVANLTYSGYQIAYCIWGFIILHLVLWLVVVVIWYFILGPLINNMRRDNVILQFLRDYWLGLVVTLMIFYGQVLASRLFFLQKYGKNFGINNRRSYHNMVYFTLFLNVLVGLASCLLRILKVLFFGIFLIGRVDYCLMYPGLEFSDKGYRAYVGFLELEVIHTHPVIVTFCHCLWQIARTESDRRAKLEKVESEHQIWERKRRKIIRNKWQLGYTLVRNPILLRDRLSNLIDFRYRGEERTGQENGGFAIQMESAEDNANPACSSEDHGTIEMKPSYRKRGQHGERHLETMKVEESIGHAHFPDVQGNGDAVQYYPFDGREQEGIKDHVDSISVLAGNQMPWKGKGNSPNNIDNIDVPHPSQPKGQFDVQGIEKIEKVCLHAVGNIGNQNSSIGDESFRTPDPTDTITMQGNSKTEMHHQPDGWSPTEATEVPVDDHIQKYDSNSDEVTKAWGCRSEPDGSVEDEDREDDPLDSSMISVFSNQSFEELLESSLDPDHISDCRQQGVDLVSYVEEEMWKNLLHEGKSTLKRAKEKDHRTDRDIERNNGMVPGKDSIGELSVEDPGNFEEYRTHKGLAVDNIEVQGKDSSDKVSFKGTRSKPCGQEDGSEEVESSRL